MSEFTVRLTLLLLLGAGTWLIIKLGRHFVETRRQQALDAAPLTALATPAHQLAPETGDPRVRILAFSSEDCHQCHQLQAPALQRVLAARGEAVEVVDIDATNGHELVETYHIMTVPSTVILDTTGRTQAVNYGFANTQRLLGQIDEVLAKAAG